MKPFLSFVLFFLLIACGEYSTDLQEVTAKSSTESSLQENSIVEATSEKLTEVDLAVVETSEKVEEQISTDVESDMPETESKLMENVIDKSKDKLETTVSDVLSAKEVVEPPVPTNVPLKPDHSSWDALLRANVSSSGKVNYSGMKSSSKELEGYITYLESFATRDSWSRNEKMVYWINLYNAATVRLIVQNYPVKSITDLSGGKPWDQNVVKVGSSSYSLNHIENKIIRPRFKDGRIHFAVNCAAKSCPPLMNKAWTSGSLTRYLEKQTKSFINSSSNSITAEKIEISKIFDWYKADFEGGNVIAFLNKYIDSPINSDAEITYKEYDWNLNK